VRNVYIMVGPDLRIIETMTTRPAARWILCKHHGIHTRRLARGTNFDYERSAVPQHALVYEKKKRKSYAINVMRNVGKL
jgi:hypothetical protein